MTVYRLPEDIFQISAQQKDDVVIHDYVAKTGTFNGRSILQKNAISLVVAGQKIMQFAEKTVHVNDNEFHFLSAGNCIVSIDLSEQVEFKSILIFFTNKILDDFYIKNDNSIQRIKSNRKINPEPYISIKKDEFIRNYIASLQLILKQNVQVSQQMKLLKFEELMLYLLEKFPDTILQFQGSAKAAFNDIEIRKTVELNIANNLTVDELAFLCNLSTSTFKRRFAGIYQTAPKTWLIEQKMKMAAKHLRHYREKPSEVYYKVGYENHSGFTKAFKKFYGISPKEFQMENLNH